MKIKIENARLSFPDLFTPGEYEGTRKYGCSLLIEPGSANDKAIRKAMEAVGTESFKAKAPAIIAAAMAGGNQKCCYWDGNLKDYDGYADMMVITAKRPVDARAPRVVDADLQPLTEDDGKPYAGCYVNASVELWAQSNKFGKTIRCTLLGVQFVKDGDAFSSVAVCGEDDFGTLTNGSDADEML